MRTTWEILPEEKYGGPNAKEERKLFNHKEYYSTVEGKFGGSPPAINQGPVNWAMADGSNEPNPMYQTGGLFDPGTQYPTHPSNLPIRSDIPNTEAAFRKYQQEYRNRQASGYVDPSADSRSKFDKVTNKVWQAAKELYKAFGFDPDLIRTNPSQGIPQAVMAGVQQEMMGPMIGKALGYATKAGVRGAEAIGNAMRPLAKESLPPINPGQYELPRPDPRFGNPIGTERDANLVYGTSPNRDITFDWNPKSWWNKMRAERGQPSAGESGSGMVDQPMLDWNNASRIQAIHGDIPMETNAMQSGQGDMMNQAAMRGSVKGIKGTTPFIGFKQGVPEERFRFINNFNESPVTGMRKIQEASMREPAANINPKDLNYPHSIFPYDYLPHRYGGVAQLPSEWLKSGGKIIDDPLGQWAHAGEVTRIPGDSITMHSVPYPVYGVPNTGPPQMMHPEGSYSFPGASHVTEFPIMAEGGPVQIKYTPSLRTQDMGQWEGQKEEPLVDQIRGTIKDPSQHDIPYGGTGESLNQFRDRVTSAFNQITSEHPEGNIALVTHSSVIKMLQAYKKAGFPDDNQVDMSHFLDCSTLPGKVYPIKQGDRTVYLVRHGETQDNKEGRLRTPDTQLTDKGRKELQGTAKALEGKDVHTIISSDLPRTQETSQTIANKISGDQPKKQRGGPIGGGSSTYSHYLNSDIPSSAQGGEYPSAEKAAEMISNPPHGKALSSKQEHYFQALKHGWKPSKQQGGITWEIL